MLFRKSTEYAIRLVLFLVRDGSERYIRIKEISELSNISFFKLSKVAQTLINSEILKSYTGPNGGVKLSNKPSEIRLIDIVMAMEGKDILDSCVLGLDNCNDKNPCTLHEELKRAKDIIVTMYKEKTVDELIDVKIEDTFGSS